MQYRLLGPLEAVHDGVPVDLGPPKQRAVLAALLLERGRVVSADALVDAVWGEDPPGSALAGLQAYVSNLRRVLRAGSGGIAPLVRRSPGYALQAGPEQVDADAFLAADDAARQAADRGDWPAAADAARAALDLWRGPVLADLADLPWAAAAAAGLAERRLRCTELRTDALLRAGRPAEALAGARQLVAAEPFGDRAHALLLLALHRSGRSADALAAYRGYAARLADELGLEPGPELRELHTAILRQDPALLPAPAVPAAALPAAPEPGAGLVGRDREVGAIERLVDDVGRGRPRWLLLSGPAGIGKTRLAEEAASRVRSAGGREAWARCPEEDGVPAWWPLRQVVRGLGGDPDELLVPPSGVDADAARFAVYERLLGLLHAAAAEGPLAVVVDDVQWADATSLRCLAYLAGALRDGAVAFVLTLRDGEGSAEALVAALARTDGVLPLPVGPLDAAAVAELVTAVAGEAVTDGEARLLADRTGGNPLFVSEYARLPREERGGSALPIAVRAVLGRRLARLRTEVTEVLTVAAVAGDVLDLGLLAATTGLPLDLLADCLEEAADERIITASRAGDGWAFAHALLREEVLARLSGVRRQRLHARLAEALAGATDRDGRTRRAQHLVAALPLADPREVVGACRRAAADAEAAWDSDAAAGWWEQALRAADRVPAGQRDDDERDDLLVARLTALGRAGRGQTALDVVDAALVEAAQSGRTATVGRLAGVLLRSSGGWPWTTYGPDPGVVQARLAELTGRVTGDRAAHVRVLAVRAVGSCYHPDPAVPDGLSRRALELAEELGDADVLADALAGRILTYVGVADHARECVELADRLVALPHREAPVDEVLRHDVLSMARAVLGDTDAAAEHVRQGIAGCDRLRLPVPRVQFRWAEAMLAQYGGDLALADALIRRAFDLHGQTELYATGVLHLARLSLRWDQGRIAEAREDLAAVPAPLPWSAAAAAETGDVATARRLLDETVPPEGPFVWDTLGHQVLLAHVVADVGAAEHAPVLLRRLEPRARYVAAIGQVGVTGPVALAVGRLHALLGDEDAARAALDLAEEVAAPSGAAPARLRIRLARALLDPAGPARDAELADVAVRADALGMRGVAAAARRAG